MDEKDKKEYEISILLESEQGKEPILSTVKAAGGEIITEGSFLRITLAYPIEKHKEATFGYVHVRLSPLKANGLKKELTRLPGTLRVLVITPPPLRQQSRGISFSKPREFLKVVPEIKTVSPLTNEDLEKRIEEILK